MDKLIKERRIVKAAITRHETAVKGFKESESPLSLETRLADVTSDFKKYTSIQSEIELIQLDGVEDENVLASLDAEHNKEREKIEKQYYSIIANIKAILLKIPTSDSNTPSNVGQSSTVINISKTPDIEPTNNLKPLPLPTFDGKPSSWYTFYDSFKSLVDDNPNLSDINKFHYLKGCLKDEALRTIESYTVSAANYQGAKDLLQKRFENKRLIVQEHLSNILNLPTITKPSQSELRHLLDTVNNNKLALSVLGLPVDSWDQILIAILVDKLDYQTRKEWQSKLEKELPKYSDFDAFIEKRCQVLDSLTHMNTTSKYNNHNHNKNSNINNSNHNSKIRTVTHVTAHKKQILCLYCKNSNHQIYQCNEFLTLSNADRWTWIHRGKLCPNCLRDNHHIDNCRSKTKCRNCNGKHNTLIHSDEPVSNNENNTTISNYACNNETVLLSTAIVLVKNIKNEFEPCRALLDPGSTANYISKSMCDRLGLIPKQTNIEIKCLNGSASSATQRTNINIKSLYNAFSANLTCIVVNKITENLPLSSLNLSSLGIPKNINLADPNFYQCNKVDLLIGAALFWELLCIGQFKATSGITFQKTQLGFIAGGVYHHNNGRAITNSPALSNFTTAVDNQDSLDNHVRKFWELENVNIDETSNNLSAEEIECERHFRENTTRDTNGRFVVKLPIKNNCIQIGNSRQTALKRFYNLERRLNKDSQLKSQYADFMSEYLNLNHMELVKEQMNDHESIYLPHHPVFKDSSTTTKLRVVFDASAKTSNGQSLNDNLIAGPVLQEDIFSIIVRFRTFQFALTADIAKMYRQIRVHPDDSNYQLIFWRNDITENVQTYRLTTLTYGTKPASFIATRCLHELAFQNRSNFPRASEIIIRDFYMDDLLTGADTRSELISIKNQVVNILKQGQFELRKFNSNETRVLNDNMDEIYSNSDMQLIKGEFTKTLGLLWNSVSDVFKYEVQTERFPRKVTKRTILSTASQIFDPLGLVGPVIMKAKIIIQQIWALKLDWDESVPSQIHSTWMRFLNELTNLSNILIPRKIIASHPPEIIELHGFCDASQLGYGAVIYLRTIKNNVCETRLICSKSRVAPLKTITLPRLELCGALLLARLISKVRSCLKINFTCEYLWTDSTIVLAWINTPSNSLKTFVSNRVSEINSLTTSTTWRHIRGEINPADVLSRGAFPIDLIANNAWFNGPTFLRDDGKWPVLETDFRNIEIPETRVTLNVVNNENKAPWLTKFSQFTKLQRVVAYVLRFLHNCKIQNNKRRGSLSTQELKNSLLVIVKLVQREGFSIDIKNLKNHKPLNHNSKLISLSPFLDGNELIRVGGRLKHANISLDAKHPLLLPRSHFVTKLLIKFEHERNLHAGLQATLAAVRQRFWVLSARNATRQIIHQCINCFKINPTKSTPKMGDLPKDRIQPFRPFLKSGVDYAGPILIKESRGRGKRLSKAYIALFVCFSTKAVHIELVFDLSTSEFLAALRRFIGRRGHPQDIYSDNGTNFIGASNELKELGNFLKNQNVKNTIENKMANLGIRWHFIPPRSPHMGGLWEINIKSMKQHLKRTIGDSHLTYSEINTLLIRIEACLNSRPLTPISCDPNDLEVLTPGHFLIGQPLTTFAEPSLEEIPTHRLSRWQVVEKIRTHFWKRWQREYLTQLQTRSKWRVDRTSNRELIDAMVILVDKNTPPLQWKLGRIVDVHPGADNTVRVVTVRTNHGTVKRALREVCILPKAEIDNGADCV